MASRFRYLPAKLDGRFRSVNSYEGGRSLRPVIGGGGFPDVEVFAQAAGTDEPGSRQKIAQMTSEECSNVMGSQSAEPLANFSATEVYSVFFEKIFQCRIIEHGFGQQRF